MRTVRDILATVTFLGTALVFYLVQTADPTAAIATSGVAASSSAAEQCDILEASATAATGTVSEHLHSAKKAVSRES